MHSYVLLNNSQNINLFLRCRLDFKARFSLLECSYSDRKVPSSNPMDAHCGGGRCKTLPSFLADCALIVESAVSLGRHWWPSWLGLYYSDAKGQSTSNSVLLVEPYFLPILFCWYILSAIVVDDFYAFIIICRTTSEAFQCFCRPWWGDPFPPGRTNFTSACLVNRCTWISLSR